MAAGRGLCAASSGRRTRCGNWGHDGVMHGPLACSVPGWLSGCLWLSPTRKPIEEHDGKCHKAFEYRVGVHRELLPRGSVAELTASALSRGQTRCSPCRDIGLKLFPIDNYFSKTKSPCQCAKSAGTSSCVQTFDRNSSKLDLIALVIFMILEGPHERLGVKSDTY
jgi:hypothetical protein